MHHGVGESMERWKGSRRHPTRGSFARANLYDLVRNARNDAMHEGAFARNLAVHLVQLSVMLEDALVNKAA